MTAWSTLDAFDRAMNVEEAARLDALKGSRRPLTAVVIRCGKGCTHATLHPLGTIPPIDRTPGVNAIAPGRWLLWLRAGPAWVRAAETQGWPIPPTAVGQNRFRVPEAARVVTFDASEADRFWWTFCKCGDVGDVPVLPLWDQVKRWRLTPDTPVTWFRAGVVVKR